MSGLTATPDIDAAFYFDLAVRAMTAVLNMKSGGSWPEMAFTKCSEYTSNVPITRSIDLISNIKVILMHSLHILILYSCPQSVSMPGAYGPLVPGVSNGLSYISYHVVVATLHITAGKLDSRYVVTLT